MTTVKDLRYGVGVGCYSLQLRTAHDMDFRLVKIVETVLLTGMFAAFGTYALEVGADPTIVSLFVLTGMLAVAGVNFHEVASVAEALRSGSIVIQTGDGDGDDE